MSQNSPKLCRLDWEGGRNNTLAGGRLLAVTSHLFAYAFYAESGQLAKALIAGTMHDGEMLSLLTGYPAELVDVYGAVLGELQGEPYNVSGNVGFIAGARIEDHPHLHLIRRNADEPASSWGLSALIDMYNRLARTSRVPQRGMWNSGT